MTIGPALLSHNTDGPYELSIIPNGSLAVEFTCQIRTLRILADMKILATCVVVVAMVIADNKFPRVTVA